MVKSQKNSKQIQRDTYDKSSSDISSCSADFNASDDAREA